MKKEKLKGLLEKVKKINIVISDIQKELRKEIFFDELEREIKSFFEENENEEFSLQEITVKIWINRGGEKLEKDTDYYLNPKYNELESMVREIISYLVDKESFLDIKQKERTEKFIKNFYKKSKKWKL